MADSDPFAILSGRLSARSTTLEAVVVRAPPGGPLPGQRACFDPSGTLLSGSWAASYSAVVAAAVRSPGRPSALIEASPGVELFVLLWAPPPRVVLFGGGHVGRAIASLLPGLGVEAVVVEDRAFFADPRRFPAPVRVVCCPLSEGADAAGIGPEDHAVVCTRGHKEDLDCVRVLLARQPAYLGLLGSRRKLREFSALLAAEGHDPEWISRVRCPVGLDLGAETPEEIAVAVVAEILAVRRGRPMGYR